MNLVLLGPSGVGKGTHAAGLAARYHLRHLATGDLFRQTVRDRTALGLLAKKYLNQGELVPDEVVDAMIEEWADRLPVDQGALFDGFPRTVDQVRFLDDLLTRLRRNLDAVIYLRVDDADVVERLSGREICRNCQAPFHRQARPPRTPGRCDRCGGELERRLDDDAGAAKTRLALFHRVTEPVLADYAARGKLIVIEGSGTIATVGNRLVAALDDLAAGCVHFTPPEELGRGMRAAHAGPVPAPSWPTRLDLVLLGGPGSGKGTQAERLSARLHLPHIATGDLFRDHLRRATPLGTLAKTAMDRGELVPDEVTDGMVEQRLAEADVADGFVLDGFPRTLPQAHALAAMMARLHRAVAGVIAIKVADASLIERLSGRLICRRCQSPYHAQLHAPRQAGRCDHCGGELYPRADDNPETVRARLVTFHRQTEPLIAFYRAAGLLHEINGEGDIARIAEQCLTTVRKIAKRPELGALLTTTA